MGSTGALGLVLAVVGGFLVWVVTTSFLGYGLGFVVGAGAGSFIWKHFSDKDKNELAAILNPPDQVFAAPLPVVWGSILDAFHNSYVETGATGRAMWQVVGEDDTRGIIHAKIAFHQMLGAGASAASHPRSIDAQVILTGEENGTRVKCIYSIFSPMGAGLVRDAIVKVQSAMQESIQANKEIEGC
ncbi:MAG: hypothetical protein JSS83_28965 [Cyanobacteria bacterium SZAS LIN-3]|nr:hypothetical protein [Cyanobacteria bacterium SZAS LIN-3]